MNPLDMFTGYKTYAAALALAVLGIIDLMNGDTNAGSAKLAQALGLAGLRKAVDNGQPDTAGK